MRVALILLLCALPNAGAALAASQFEAPKASDDRLTADVVKAAKTAFPLTVLTIHKITRQDGTIVYVFSLDARRIPGAPTPIITSFIAIAPGARTDAIRRALWEASAEVVKLLEEHRQRVLRPIEIRPDLIAPAGE